MEQQQNNIVGGKSGGGKPLPTPPVNSSLVQQLNGSSQQQPPSSLVLPPERYPQQQRRSHDPSAIASATDQSAMPLRARPGPRRVSEADSHYYSQNKHLYSQMANMSLNPGMGVAASSIAEYAAPASASSNQGYVQPQYQQQIPHAYYDRQAGSHYSPLVASASLSTASSANQQIQYYPPQHVPYQQQQPQHKLLVDNTDTISVHSAAASSAPSSSANIPHENLEAYRMEVKASKDPIKQFEFAKQLVLVAEEMRKNPQGLDPQKIRKNRDILHHEALKWIKKAASATYKGKTGLPDALFYLADCYGNGNLGLTIDHDRAFGYYTQGAKQDHPASIYRTGVCYEVGAGPKKDHSRAVQYYRKSAALGDPAALFKVGMILLEGSLGQTKNGKEAVNLLKRAAGLADESTPYALHELALLYEGTNLDPSTGIVPDPVYSFELFLKAAKLGYAPSQYKLGMSHEYGYLGLAVDAKRAIAWYTKAAQQGDAEAELALSGWYLIGHEPLISQSNKEAFLWAKKAANKGLSKAEYAMGYFMEHGIGTVQNLEEARRWYIRAAGQGNTRAIARLSDKGSKQKSESSLKPSDWKKSKDAQKGECTLM